MEIIKIVKNIVELGTRAKMKGEKIDILKEMGYDGSLSKLRVEAALDPEKARLYKEYGKVRGEISNVSKNKLAGVCSLYEGKLLKRKSRVEYAKDLSRVGVNSTNFLFFIGVSDPTGFARGKDALDLNDVSDECLKAYLEFIKPF